MNRITARTKIVEELDRSRHNIGTITGPYLLDENDPMHNTDKKVQEEKSRKVLTISKSRRILDYVIKRKDDKPMKIKKQTNYMQNGAIALLAIGAVEGVTELLGGQLKDAMVAAVLVFVLFALAIDYRK